MTVLDLDELSAAVGTDLGRSGWTAVDQHRIDTFAETTEDRQWIHIDVERAKSGPFGGPIAHGYLTLSLVSAMLLEVLEVKGAAAAINYGLDRVRFPAPVPVGSRVRGHGEIIAVVEVPGGFQTTTRITVERDGGDRPVCVADVLTRFVADEGQGDRA